MRVISSNINGLANAIGRGFFDWLSEQNADVVCVQELNCSSLPDSLMRWCEQQGYEVAASLPTARHGGTAIFSKTALSRVELAESTLLAHRGQYVAVTISGVNIASVYVTLGNGSEERDAFSNRFNALAAGNTGAIICGDFNIIAARHDSDLWYSSKRNGYRDAERSWLSGLMLDHWSDALRLAGAAGADGLPVYTWWSRHAGRFERNKGTRLDYQLSCPAMTARIASGSGTVFRDTYRGVRISDHGPITVDYAVAL